MTSTNPYDRWQALAAGLYMSIVGYSVLAGIPVISTAWSSLLGFSEPQVGRVAGADLGGLSAGAVLAAIVISRCNRRWLIVASISGAVVTNGLCVLFQDYTSTLILRFLAGTASGVFTGVAVATLGARTDAARAFNYLLFSFAFVQAAELYWLPKLSMSAIYTVFAVSYLPALLLLPWVPARATGLASHESQAKAAPTVQQHHLNDGMMGHSSLVPWLCLLAMALTYVNIGAYWTYIELAASDSLLDGEWVSSVLVWVSFFAVLGCFVATVISDRFGLALPLLLTLLIHAACVAILIPGMDKARFFVSIYAFNFLWIFIDVYQMGSVARLDSDGRFASLMPAAQGLGQILGPNIAASLLAASYGYPSIFALCAGASLLAALVYAVAYVILSRDELEPNALGA
ncbi:MAG: MFS transporter [Pseudomonadota bacterium]